MKELRHKSYPPMTFTVNDYNIESVLPTYPKTQKKTLEIFTFHRDSVARNSKEIGSGVTLSENIALSVEELNTLGQRMK